MQVNIKYSGAGRFTAQVHGYSINIVAGKQAQSSAESMSPLEAFLMSVGACVGVYVIKYCENAKIDSSSLQITVSGDLGENKPIRFENIKVKIKLNQDLGARKNSFLQFVKNCPIHNTLSHSPVVRFSV